MLSCILLTKNLVNKYGVIPQAVYPDAFSSTNSGLLDWLLTTKLRENALVLREIVTSSSNSDRVFVAKQKMMESIYGAMVLAFGRPPKPDEAFEWKYTDSDGKFHRMKSTAKEFYKSLDFVAGDHFSLINDPRNEYNKLYTVELLKNSSRISFNIV
jgi:bleomycin hydrolase